MKLAWQQIPSTTISEILCLSGLDGVVLDTEHGAFNNETLCNCIQVITLSNKKCLVRVTEPNKTLVRMCLDAGASGIIFSTVEYNAHCVEIFDMCDFPSKGGRRGMGLVRENSWGLDDLIKEAPIVVAQIETALGIEKLENTFGHGFDYYLIGPYDLSASVGIPGDLTSQEFIDAIKKFEEIIPENKRAIHLPTQKNVEENIDKYENYGIICVGMDTTILLEGYEKLNSNPQINKTLLPKVEPVGYDGGLFTR